MFIQPDWFPVTEQGVGTNRYAYANNDPINKFDPSGNGFFSSVLSIALFFIPSLQPLAVAGLVAGAAAIDTAIAGGDLGDVVKSAAIGFATALAMAHLRDSGVFGKGGGEVSRSARFSTRGSAGLVAGKESATAYVGGFGDKLTGIVKRISDLDPGSEYFQHNQGKKLGNWIGANSHKNITVVGHSFGGNTAARVIAKGNFVDTLITVDPVSAGVVGQFRPNFADVVKNTGRWINYDSVHPSLTGGGNFWANVGRAYDNAPAAFTPNHFTSGLSHVDICKRYCRQ